jgi:hypothetical protein
MVTASSERICHTGIEGRSYVAAASGPLAPLRLTTTDGCTVVVAAGGSLVVLAVDANARRVMMIGDMLFIIYAR